ncbi:MAG: polyphosphate kinase 2 family protein [Candidatus Sumerlaeia bacterium]|nr:polyphosphate kinase 2 family protein [Candidatus Sumerlaeia bacterium]
MWDRYRVRPGSRVRLREWDPDDTGGFQGTRVEVETAFAKLNHRLEALQELLYAESKHKMLVVLQAMDCGGKDSVIRRVFQGVNPQGVSVMSFKAPTPRELSHDYLWRVHAHAPGRGQIVIFNRSHYEDVLIVRVHKLVPRSVWERRYRHIVEFERMLADEGTTILKFYLNISKAEQKKQLEDRLNDPTKKWKFRIEDLEERRLWPQYMTAYEDALSRTSTDFAPWYIIPSNHRWYRNWAIARILVEALESLNMQYPQPSNDLSAVRIK